MNPEDVERLLGKLEAAPPPQRLEGKILADGERILGRPARRTRPWGIAGVAAACLLLSVVLWRILFPHPGDPDAVRCHSTTEFETHLDQKAAAGPPAFPSVASIRETYEPLFRRADGLKPLAEELGWQKIPWVTDLDEAQRLARTERRPLFLWVSSDDPLGRCCACAAGLRGGPLSRDELVRRISADFVPAAVDRKTLTKGKGEELLRSLQRQKPQYHGIWIVTPEGKVLGANEDPKGKDLQVGWTRDILDMLETSLKAFGPVEPRTVARVDFQPDRGSGVRPDGSVSLAVYTRLMRRGARDGPVVFDSLTLAPSEWALFFPARGAAGEEWILPDALARKFCRILSPVSDQEFMPRPEHATVAELRAAVASIEGGIATIRLSGRWESTHSKSDRKPIHASASGEGVAVVDVRRKTMQSFLMVTTGAYDADGPSKARESGAVLEWNAAK